MTLRIYSRILSPSRLLRLMALVVEMGCANASLKGCMYDIRASSDVFDSVEEEQTFRNGDCD